MNRTADIYDDRTFYLKARRSNWGHAAVRRGCVLLAQVDATVGQEADLALCLSALVEAGIIDVDKLRAALVIAAPVAREKVAEASREAP